MASPKPAASRRSPTTLTIPELKLLFTKVFANWGADNVTRLSAAFSFYAVLSLAPILVLAVVAAGSALGESDARDVVLREVRSYIGKDAGAFLGTLLESSQKPSASRWATIISLLVTFFSASNLFLQLQETINSIWGIRQTGPIFKNLILGRLLAFLAVLLFGGLVLAWAAFDSVTGYLARTGGVGAAWHSLSPLMTVVLLTLVFSFTYRAIPRGFVAWSDVWLGALVAAVGFAASKYLLSLYFTYSGVAAAYGSAGALVVILLWVYYTSQIYFFGAEIVNTYANEFGTRRTSPQAATQYS